ncbi:MAG: ferritin [Methanobacteriota archaeon]
MALSKAIQQAINEQIKGEFESAYAYLAMVSYFEHERLPGLSKWMRDQAAEELQHGMKLFDFIHARGGHAELHAIGKPPGSWGSPVDAARHALTHEQKVTGMIHRLYELAASEKDYATQAELQWFITEQVEEEKKAGDLVDRLQRAGAEGPALLMLDMQLSKTPGPK